MLIDERTYERLQRRNQEALTNAENIATIIKEQIIAPACQDGITDFTLMGVIQEEIMPLVLESIKEAFPIMYREEADFIGWLLDRGWIPPARMDKQSLKQPSDQLNLPTRATNSSGESSMRIE